jgi:anti-anti-sigma regulatory factor
LTLAAVDGLRASLLAALDRGIDLVVECSGATDVDLSFLQLLISARLSARQRGRSLTLKGAEGGPVRAALAACGLSFPDACAPTEDA